MGEEPVLHPETPGTRAHAPGGAEGAAADVKRRKGTTAGDELALVELEEGPVMPTNIVGCPLEEVRVGMPVEVVLENLTPDIVVPRFRPRA